MEQHSGTGCRTETHVSKSRGCPPTSSLTSADGCLFLSQLSSSTMGCDSPGRGTAAPTWAFPGAAGSHAGCGQRGPRDGSLAGQPSAAALPPAPAPRVSHLVVKVQHGSHRPARTETPSSERSPRRRRRRTNRNRAQAPRSRSRPGRPGPAPELSLKAGLKSFHWGFFGGCRAW